MVEPSRAHGLHTVTSPMRPASTVGQPSSSSIGTSPAEKSDHPNRSSVKLARRPGHAGKGTHRRKKCSAGFYLVAAGLSRYPLTVCLLCWSFCIAIFVGYINIPLGTVDVHNGGPLHTIHEWGNIGILPADYSFPLNWWMYNVVFFPIYILSTVGCVGLAIHNFSPYLWPRSWGDLACFGIPPLVITVVMNTVVWYSPRQALVSSKLWVVFNTLVCTGYGMHYAVLRNMWERKHWEAKMRLIAKTADISPLASHVNSKHVRSVSNGVEDEEAGECAKEVIPHHLESPQTGSGHDMAMHKLENEPLPTVQILWLLVSICFGASTYFIGQVWSWAYFKTTPHPLWLDLVLIYTLRLFIVGVTTIGTILLHAKLGPRHTIYAYTFFCDMIYWMLYRNVFTAAFSSTWTIILFGAINFVQRVAWVTFRTSRYYHRIMIWLSDWNKAGVLKAFFAAQHGVSDSASIMTRTASGSMSSLGLDILDGELAEFNNPTDENKADSAVRGISEPSMDQEAGMANSETKFSTLERAATTSIPNKRNHLRSTVAIKSTTSVNQVNDNTPNSRYSLPPLGEATETWSYTDYTKAQVLFQAFNAVAQLITMVCFVVSIPAIRRGPNAGAYPSLTILLDDTRYRRVMFETLSTFVSEVLGSLVGFWLVHRMTGRKIWQEWVKFVSRNPRTFVLTMVMAIHVLMDSAVMLVNLEFDP